MFLLNFLFFLKQQPHASVHTVVNDCMAHYTTTEEDNWIVFLQDITSRWILVCQQKTNHGVSDADLWFGNSPLFVCGFVLCF